MTLKGRQTPINKECRTTYFGKKDDIYFWNKEINLHLKNIQSFLKKRLRHTPRLKVKLTSLTRFRIFCAEHKQHFSRNSTHNNHMRMTSSRKTWQFLLLTKWNPVKCIHNITPSLGHIIPHNLGSRNGIGSYHTTIQHMILTRSHTQFLNRQSY